MMQNIEDRSLLEGLMVFQLDGAGGARELGPETLEQALEEQKSLWIHVNFSDPAGARWLLQGSHIDPVAAAAMVQDESRPRSLHTAAGVLTILRGVNFNQGADFEDMISVRIWVDKARVVTASRRRLKSLEDIRSSLEQQNGPRTPAGILTEIIDRLGYYISEAIERFETSLETVEAEVSETQAAPRNSPFTVLRRQTARIRRYLAPQRDALESISRLQDSVFDRDCLHTLREQANRFTLALEDLDLVRERAMVAQEEFLGILAHEQNNRMLVLSIVAAVFLPLSFLTGLMGMNVAGLPGTENRWAFAILVVLMLLVSMVILLLFRRKKWV